MDRLLQTPKKQKNRRHVIVAFLITCCIVVGLAISLWLGSERLFNTNDNKSTSSNDAAELPPEVSTEVSDGMETSTRTYTYVSVE